MPGTRYTSLTLSMMHSMMHSTIPSSQIKDPAADELRDLAVEALDGVDYGEEPKPERYIEFVFGAEIVELKGFVGEIKVRTY